MPASKPMINDDQGEAYKQEDCCYFQFRNLNEIGLKTPEMAVLPQLRENPLVPKDRR